MSYDGIVTCAMVRELKDNLILGKIEKIYQPQPEQLLFQIHTNADRKRLFVSAASNHSAVYLVDDSPENPANPPLFCMVLRKHLGAARIMDIVQHENDRIIEFLLETVDELGFNVNRKLIIEIMGKHSNVLLVDLASNKIIESIKHVGIDVNRARQILPGKKYVYPPEQAKTPFSVITAEKVSELLSGQLQPERNLLGGIQGISPALAESMASVPSPYEWLDSLRQAIVNRSYTPLVYVRDGKPADFHIVPLLTYEEDPGYEVLHFDTVSRAAAYYFINRESSNTVKQKSNDLQRVVKSQLDKLKLKVQRLNEDLNRAQNSDKYRLCGELLTANLHLVKPGMDKVTVTSYYDNSEVEIPLDPRYSPAKNAQNFFKKYGKAKTAIKEKQLQLEDAATEINYLESVSSFIERAKSIEELQLIRSELVESGYIRYRRSAKSDRRSGSSTGKKDKPKPYMYTLTSGKTVLVGRNNRENDWLTFKKASSPDIWFHTKDIPGSHVILVTDGEAPTDKELFEAASIAAFHSKGSSSSNVPVDYTKIKYVKKPSGSKPGYVIFTHNRTLYVDPSIPE